MIWDSGKILAHLMADKDIENKKILEVGCGLAISSLVLNQRNAQITSTDYHPEVESFLKENARINLNKEIPFFLADWKNPSVSEQKFDLIIGSDLLYEKEHSILLSSFIEQYAEKECEVIIVDAGRGYVNKFTKNMLNLTYSYDQKRPRDQEFLTDAFKGTVNYYKR